MSFELRWRLWGLGARGIDPGPNDLLRLLVTWKKGVNLLLSCAFVDWCHVHNFVYHLAVVPVDRSSWFTRPTKFQQSFSHSRRLFKRDVLRNWAHYKLEVRRTRLFRFKRLEKLIVVAKVIKVMIIDDTNNGLQDICRRFVLESGRTWLTVIH
jgi:hypothetical protein